MKYVILVSHGKLASGLANALGMLAGNRKDLIACGLEDGKSADEFAVEFAKAIEGITTHDEVLMLGDLLGGSPLTTAANVINEKGLAANTRVVGGMNLPLALTALLMKDSMDLDGLKEAIMQESKEAIKEFAFAADDSDDEDDV
ncbi:PTS fructose transporter subunit IIA [Erysipelotrichaceae bacterium RD49]|nr:PTS fructose transporter subunit IIA [Erysipelotrichaceae bacterium RD49]